MQESNAQGAAIARQPLWLWPNRLGVDAPLVALVWQDFVARCFHIPLLATGRLALLLTVWAIYLADRMVDTRWVNRSAGAGAHAFCQRHAQAVRWLLAAIVGLDAALCLFWLWRPLVWNGLWVMAAVAAYFDAFPLRGIAGITKAVTAAVLFALGVFLVAWARGGGMMLLVPGAMFAALCLANLFLLRAWGRHGHGSRPMVLALIGLAAVCAWAAAFSGRGLSLWYGGVGLGALGLAALAFGGGWFRRETRRVLADAVLLSPLLLWTLTR